MNIWQQVPACKGLGAGLSDGEGSMKYAQNYHNGAAQPSDLATTYNGLWRVAVRF